MSAFLWFWRLSFDVLQFIFGRGQYSGEGYTYTPTVLRKHIFHTEALTGISTPLRCTEISSGQQRGFFRLFRYTEVLLIRLSHLNWGSQCNWAVIKQLSAVCSSMVHGVHKYTIRPSLGLWNSCGPFMTDQVHKGWRSPHRGLKKLLNSSWVH